jgi:hypothetical protein
MEGNDCGLFNGIHLDFSGDTEEIHEIADSGQSAIRTEHLPKANQ